MAEHEIGTVIWDDIGKSVTVALHPAHGSGDPGCLGTPSQQRESIRARVDDGDGVSVLGERYGESPVPPPTSRTRSGPARRIGSKAAQTAAARVDPRSGELPAEGDIMAPPSLTGRIGRSGEP